MIHKNPIEFKNAPMDTLGDISVDISLGEGLKDPSLQSQYIEYRHAINKYGVDKLPTKYIPIHNMMLILFTNPQSVSYIQPFMSHTSLPTLLGGIIIRIIHELPKTKPAVACAVFLDSNLNGWRDVFNKYNVIIPKWIPNSPSQLGRLIDYVNNHVDMNLVIIKAYELMVNIFNMKPNPNNTLDVNDPTFKIEIEQSSEEIVTKFFHMNAWLEDKNTLDIADKAIKAAMSSMKFEFNTNI